MKKYIILSVNGNQDYLFYLPLTCKLWQKFGWTPIVFYNGDDTDQYRLAMNQPFNAVILKLNSIPGYRSDTITQTSRLYATCLDFLEPTDYLMTGDIDMIPLSDYWHPDTSKVTVYGHDLTGYTQYPICYIGATVENWRKFMKLDSMDYQSMLKRDLDSMPNASDPAWEKYWSVDQELATQRIKEFSFEKDFINRGQYPNGYAKGRIDRGSWNDNLETFIDCHMHRDLFKAFYGNATEQTQLKWRQHLTMLENRFPDEKWGWFVEYTKQYSELAYGK